MSLATEILSLRRDRSSSVETLLALIDWEQQTSETEPRIRRHYAVELGDDTVLMAVAVHAAEAERALMLPPGTRPTIAGVRNRRRSRPGHLSQMVARRSESTACAECLIRFGTSQKK